MYLTANGSSSSTTHFLIGASWAILRCFEGARYGSKRGAFSDWHTDTPSKEAIFMDEFLNANVLRPVNLPDEDHITGPGYERNSDYYRQIPNPNFSRYRTVPLLRPEVQESLRSEKNRLPCDSEMQNRIKTTCLRGNRALMEIFLLSFLDFATGKIAECLLKPDKSAELLQFDPENTLELCSLSKSLPPNFRKTTATRLEFTYAVTTRVVSWLADDFFTCWGVVSGKRRLSGFNYCMDQELLCQNKLTKRFEAFANNPTATGSEDKDFSWCDVRDCRFSRDFEWINPPGPKMPIAELFEVEHRAAAADRGDGHCVQIIKDYRFDVTFGVGEVILLSDKIVHQGYTNVASGSPPFSTVPNRSLDLRFVSLNWEKAQKLFEFLIRSNVVCLGDLIMGIANPLHAHDGSSRIPYLTNGALTNGAKPLCIDSKDFADGIREHVTVDRPVSDELPSLRAIAEHILAPELEDGAKNSEGLICERLLDFWAATGI